VQDALKLLLINSLVLRQIDYASGRQCIMDVDSSFRGAGYVLLQCPSLKGFWFNPG
jgi:hypothetical protein